MIDNTSKTTEELDEMRLCAIAKVAGCERPDSCFAKVCRCRGEARAVREADDAAGLVSVSRKLLEEIVESAKRNTSLHADDCAGRSKRFPGFVDPDKCDCAAGRLHAAIEVGRIRGDGE